MLIIYEYLYFITNNYNMLDYKSIFEKSYSSKNDFAISFIMISYLIYLLTKKKFDTNCLRKLEYKDLGTILLVSLSTIMGSLILIYLLQKYDASFIIPNLQPVVIVLTILIGYFIYKETLDKKKIIGILFIISFDVFVFLIRNI